MVDCEESIVLRSRERVAWLLFFDVSLVCCGWLGSGSGFGKWLGFLPLFVPVRHLLQRN